MSENNKILNHDPLGDTDDILRKEYYGRDSSESESEPEHEEAAKAAPAKRKAKKPKPTHYKVVCISLYTPDIENLEVMVAELKRRGHTKANKSQLIRYALRQIDLDAYPEPQP